MSVGDYSNNMERNDYDIASSETVQQSVFQVAQELEQALDTQKGQINDLMARYQADGVSEQYQALAGNWNQAGDQVRVIIDALKKTLEGNDDIARAALSKAGAAANHFH